MQVLIIFFGKKRFRFEKWWLEKESFTKVVEKAWSQPCNETKSINRWQFRVRTFRKLVRGWAANEVAEMNREKVALADEYNRLDKLLEVRPLLDSERSRMDAASRKLEKIWVLEEIKARQRSRERERYRRGG